MSEICELTRGLERTRCRIIETPENGLRPIIIGVAGGSGSGKTTHVAQKIKEMFLSSSILSIDDYCFGPKIAEKIIGSRNLDDPRAYELALAGEHIRSLKNRFAVQKPVYVYAEGRRVRYETFQPKKVIIVEGLFALYPGIVEELDLKIFVDIAVHGSLIRRILRDVERTGQTEEQILEQYVATVYPMFKLYVEPTKVSADIVIVNEYVPEIEANSCESREVQIKAIPPERLVEEKLKNLGFTKTSTVYQKDTYFLAPNWPDDYSDEMMRIREEGGRYFLAYKGPRGEGPFRIKPKIEFEVKPSLKNALRLLGYKEIISFDKKRERFSNQSLEVVFDEFMNGCHFLEFRTANPEGESEILQYLTRLGINPRFVTQKSYLEIMLGR